MFKVVYVRIYFNNIETIIDHYFIFALRNIPSLRNIIVGRRVTILKLKGQELSANSPSFSEIFGISLTSLTLNLHPDEIGIIKIHPASFIRCLRELNERQNMRVPCNL